MPGRAVRVTLDANYQLIGAGGERLIAHGVQPLELETGFVRPTERIEETAAATRISCTYLHLSLHLVKGLICCPIYRNCCRCE